MIISIFIATFYARFILYLEKNAQLAITNTVYTKECSGSIIKVVKSLGGEIQYARPLIGTLPAPALGSEPPTSCQVPSNPIIKLPLNLRYNICDKKYMFDTKAVWNITLMFDV